MTTLAAGRRPALGAVAFLAGSVLVHIGNYAFNLVAVRFLTPAEYADVALAVTSLLLVGFVTVGFQTATARTVAEHDGVQADGLAGWFASQAFRLGLALGALVLLSAPALAGWFQTGSPAPFLAVAAGLPFAFSSGVGRGRAQGRGEFGRLAASFQAEMLVRLGLGAALIVAGFGAAGGVGALAASLVVAALAVRGPRRAGEAPDPAQRRRLVRTLWPSMALLVGEALINHGDTIIVKQAYDPVTAGEFAALALIGRAVFFATWPVSMIVFPEAARRAAAGRPTKPLLLASVGAVMAIGAAGTTLAAAAPEAIVDLLLGPDYATFAHLLAPYVAATALFAGAATVVSFILATGSDMAGGLAAGAGLVCSAVIAWFPNGISGVVWLQVGLMGSYLAGTLVWAARRDERAR